MFATSAFNCCKQELYNLLHRRGRERCLRQAFKSNFGVVRPDDPLIPKFDRFIPLPRGPLVPIWRQNNGVFV